MSGRTRHPLTLSRHRGCGGGARAGADILGHRRHGIGNTTRPSRDRLDHHRRRGQPGNGRGTGLDDNGAASQDRAHQSGARGQPGGHTGGIDVLAKLGGYEIGGLAAPILGAGGAPPSGGDRRLHLRRSRFSSPGPSRAKGEALHGGGAQLGRDRPTGHHGAPRLVPLIDLNLRLGEGTGAGLGITILDISRQDPQGDASFGGAGVTEPSTGSRSRARAARPRRARVPK